MRRIVLVAMFAALSLAVAFAQDTPQGDVMQFEVASIRPCRVEGISREQFLEWFMTPTPNAGIRYYKPCTTVHQLILFAYDVPQSRLRGDAVWTRTEYFRVEAIAARRVDIDEMRLLVRQLLAERFALKSHTEVSTVRQFTLILARPDGRLGPNVKPAATDCLAHPSGDPEGGLVQLGKDGFPVCGIGGGTFDGMMTRAYRGMTMQQFAQVLPGVAREVVVDRTGLDGLFDFTITHLVEDQGGLRVGSDASLLQAIERQLGLEVERGEGPAEILLIDSVQRPTEN